MSTGEKALLAILILIVLAMAKGYHGCRAEGGQYVRGAMWMECITSNANSTETSNS